MRTSILLTAVMGIGAVGLVFGQDEAQPTPVERNRDHDVDEERPDGDLRRGGGRARGSSRGRASSTPGSAEPSVEMRPSDDVLVDVDHDSIAPDDQRNGRSVDGPGPGLLYPAIDEDSDGPWRDRNSEFGGGFQIRGGRGIASGRGRRRSSSPSQQEIAVQQLSEKLQRAPAEQREEIAASLKQELSQLFDTRTAEREAQIKQLEERIQSLREQLNKRVEVKDEIIQLRLQTLVNEANGLTF